MINAILFYADLDAWRHLSPELFLEEEEPLYNAVADHVERYGSLPTAKVVREQLGREPAGPEEPVAYYLDHLRTRAARNALQSRVEDYNRR